VGVSLSFSLLGELFMWRAGATRSGDAGFGRFERIVPDADHGTGPVNGEQI
jgi:hypothetical protein